MSVVEDSRKIVQDFLAPELRELKARMDAQDKRLEAADTHLRELKQELKDFRAETINSFKDLRLEMHGSCKDVRMEIKDLRADTVSGFHDMQLSLKELRSDMRLSERVEKIERSIAAEHKH